MTRFSLHLVGVLLLFFAARSTAAIRYVDSNSTNAVPPYTNWGTASTTVQAAVNQSVSGDTVVVTNGTYQDAISVPPDGVGTRLVLLNSVTVQSVNGPNYTIIDCGGIGRCAYLSNGAVLSGFTLYHGAGGNGGGVFCGSSNEVVSNCLVLNNTGSSGGGVYGGTLYDCTISGNTSGNSTQCFGGGAYGSTLNNCIVSGNSCGNTTGDDGGGAYLAVLNYCTVTGNSVNMTYGNGGGACKSTLNNCIMSGNKGMFGGAADLCTLNNCLITTSYSYNGACYSSTLNSCVVSNNQLSGAVRSTLNNCIVTDNTANQGGGAFQSTLVNCTVCNNNATYGGGVDSCTVENSIIYYNYGGLGGDNYYATQNDGPMTLNYCCTIPLPTSGSGNISTVPDFLNTNNDFHLQGYSPCIEAGKNSYVSFTNDFDGNVRIVGNYVDLGAFEYQTPTFIQVQPQSQLGDAGLSVSFNVVAESPLPTSLQWLFNGATIKGATNSVLTISNLSTNNQGMYSVIVSNNFVTLTSSNATLTIVYPIPVIVSQPTNNVVFLGSNAQFSVNVSNPYPTVYQWQFNNTNLANGGRISGATSSNLMITSVQPSDGGTYRVIVTNYYGAATSSNAALTVLASPIILAQPTNTTSMSFNPVNLSVSVSAEPPVYYQWQKNGINLTDAGEIVGSQTANLALTNAQSGDSGQYGVIVSNSLGIVLSSTAAVTIVPVVSWVWDGQAPTPPPQATNLVDIAVGFDWFGLHPDGTVTEWGGVSQPPESATNVVAIAAGETGAVALRVDGTVVVWSNTPPAPAGLTNVVAISAGYNHYLALKQDGTLVGWGDNGAGEATPPGYATNIVGIAAGNGFSSALTADGTVIGWGLDYSGEIDSPSNATNLVAIKAGTRDMIALRTDQTAIGWGATVPPDGTTNISALAAGNDDIMVLRNNGTVEGWGFFGPLVPPANLTNITAVSANELSFMALVEDPEMQMPPIILQNPINWNGFAGQAALFVSKALGSPPLQYQWSHNGAPLTGETHTWLWLPSAGVEQVGTYAMVVTNGLGQATTQIATLTEQPWATIGSQPTNEAVIAGSSATLSVGMYGTPPFYYQWYFNNSPLVDDLQYSGTSTSTLIVTNLSSAESGSYFVLVSNAYNGTTSAVVTLTVLYPAMVTNQPNSQSVLLSNNVSFTAGATGTGSISYHWLLNGTNLSNGGRISGANSPTLTISKALMNDDGSYQLVAANNYGTNTSLPATLTVYVPVQITSQPSSEAMLLGSNALFTVAATGTALGYQWFFNGSPLADNTRISGSSSGALTVSNIQNSDAGGYYVLCTNLLSFATSMTATLTPLTASLPSTRYVDLNCTNPVTPFLSWGTAATNIQDAIDAAVAGDTILVTNGTFQLGGRVVYGALTNRVVIDKSVCVQSINGPAFTTILGSQPPGSNAVRCVYLTNNALLVGFTLSNGASRNAGDTIKEQSGGGVWCEATNCLIENCTLISNSAPQYGGGVASGYCSNCVLEFNSATLAGGGAYNSQLNNCLVISNAAGHGGGAYNCIGTNCQLVANSSSDATGGAGAYQGTFFNSFIGGNRCSVFAAGGGNGCNFNGCLILSNGSFGVLSGTLINCTITGHTNAYGTSSSSLRNCIIYSNGINYSGGTLTYCCTIPLPSGVGNFTNNPLFVNPTGGDFHLKSNSPCINAGKNTYVTNGFDLDGNPRIDGGTVDMGAYEFQNPSSIISYQWLQLYGLPTDGSADFADADGDGMNNYREWIAGTNPTNASSVLLLRESAIAGLGIKLTWSSVVNKTYQIQRGTNLLTQPMFSIIASNLAGSGGILSYTDTNATNTAFPYFYRIGVH